MVRMKSSLIFLVSFAFVLVAAASDVLNNGVQQITRQFRSQMEKRASDMQWQVFILDYLIHEKSVVANVTKPDNVSQDDIDELKRLWNELKKSTNLLNAENIAESTLRDLREHMQEMGSLLAALTPSNVKSNLSKLLDAAGNVKTKVDFVRAPFIAIRKESTHDTADKSVQQQQQNIPSPSHANAEQDNKVLSLAEQIAAFLKELFGLSEEESKAQSSERNNDGLRGISYEDDGKVQDRLRAFQNQLDDLRFNKLTLIEGADADKPYGVGQADLDLQKLRWVELKIDLNLYNSRNTAKEILDRVKGFVKSMDEQLDAVNPSNVLDKLFEIQTMKDKIKRELGKVPRVSNGQFTDGATEAEGKTETTATATTAPKPTITATTETAPKRKVGFLGLLYSVLSSPADPEASDTQNGEVLITTPTTTNRLVSGQGLVGSTGATDVLFNGLKRISNSVFIQVDTFMDQVEGQVEILAVKLHEWSKETGRVNQVRQEHIDELGRRWREAKTKLAIFNSENTRKSNLDRLHEYMKSMDETLTSVTPKNYWAKRFDFENLVRDIKTEVDVVRQPNLF